MVKDIFARIWALWGLCWFFLTMLLFYPLFLVLRYFFKEPERTKYFIDSSRVWMGIFLPLAGCPMRVKGRAYFKKGQAYIVVCNHNSLLDVPVTSPAIPGANKTIAKIEFTRVPLFGLIYRLGSVLVDRKDESSRRESYIHMKHALQQGMNVCIYPEGTRNKTAQPLKEFYEGAFRLAKDTGFPVIPGIITGTRAAMPANKSFYLFPHRLEMHFLPPVTVGEKETAKEFKERVFKIMWEGVEQYR